MDQQALKMQVSTIAPPPIESINSLYLGPKLGEKPKLEQPKRPVFVFSNSRFQSPSTLTLSCSAGVNVIPLPTY